MARPGKLNEELINELCDWVASDTPLRFCAEGCGITYMSFNNWLKQGEADFNNEVDSIFAELFYRIKKTYAQVVRNSVTIIKTKPEGTNWQGECWIRQRRDNEFMDKQEIIGDGEKVVVQLGNIKGKHIKNERDIN